MSSKQRFGPRFQASSLRSRSLAARRVALWLNSLSNGRILDDCSRRATLLLHESRQNQKRPALQGSRFDRASWASGMQVASGNALLTKLQKEGQQRRGAGSKIADVHLGISNIRDETCTANAILLHSVEVKSKAARLDYTKARAGEHSAGHVWGTRP